MSIAMRQPSLQSSQDQPIRVVVVDDAVVVRGLIGRWVEEEPQLSLIASHRNGKLAVDDIERCDPDVIILDIEMPVMDGLAALPHLIRKCPHAHIVMASTLTRRNAEISLKALSLGASDYIAKPETNSGVSTSAYFKRELIAKVSELGVRAQKRRGHVKASSQSEALRTPLSKPSRLNSSASTSAETAIDRLNAVAKDVYPLRPWSPVPPRLLLVGSSTGGPQALATFFKTVGPVLEHVPVIVVQHMPATFTPILAENLGKVSGCPSKEGEHLEIIKKGHIYVAPGGKHMRLFKEGADFQIQLDDGPQINFCKPAVDPLFMSACECFGAATLGVILTGMGSDGADGVKKIAEKGGSVLSQDQETSVVWGMPKAAAESGACSAVLPLDQLGQTVHRILSGGRP